MKKAAIIIIIILVAIIVVGGFLACKYSLVSNFFNKNAQLEQEIGDWKTYRNDEYGFEFSYPMNVNGHKFNSHFLDYKNPNDLAKNNIDPNPNSILFFSGSVYLDASTNPLGCFYPVDIYVTRVLTEDINVWFTEIKNSLETPFYYESSEVRVIAKVDTVIDIHINGRVGKQYDVDIQAPHYNRYFAVINNGNLYEIKTRQTTDCSQLIGENIFNRIVSAFKFTK